ncbi:MAG TPA: agenet domain-containing protein [Spirochaetota bacterium]|nr:agenet domain-containing protein [Spirochaetota bacterium]HPN82940.1 agenet domain-containing protein [Spirochaetota bacterium]
MPTLRHLAPAFICVLLCVSNCTRQSGPATTAERVWDPDRSSVFVVGVLQWQDSDSLASFDPQNRRDAELVEFFRQQGVPQSRIVYLQDSEATSARIANELPRFLSQAKEGETVFIYYCGHGYKDDAGKGFFASYDTGSTVSGWEMASIPRMLEQHFTGATAILAADCCYSGVLAADVRQVGSRLKYVVFTSSSASEISTGNWTFTEALLDGLRGHPGCDLDNNGAVSAEELGMYIAADMATGEEQVSVFAVNGDFSSAANLASAAAKDAPTVGKRVKVRYQGQVYNARITSADKDRFRIHWLGFRDYPDEWVAASDVVFPETATQPVDGFDKGAAVEVLWKKRWYPATVLERNQTMYSIQYTGYGSEWNEWVSSKRIRKPAS